MTSPWNDMPGLITINKRAAFVFSVCENVIWLCSQNQIVTIEPVPLSENEGLFFPEIFFLEKYSEEKLINAIII